MTAPQLGDPYCFTPAALIDSNGNPKGLGGKPLVKKVIGKIVHINRIRRHFTVVYNLNGVRLMESFKF